MLIVMSLSLAACGKKSDTKEPEPEAEKSIEEIYNLDMKLEQKQPMSDKLVNTEKLSSVYNETFGGNRFVDDDDENAGMTYKDLAKIMGVDATVYEYYASGDYQVFYWNSSEDSNVYMKVYFNAGDGSIESVVAKNFE